MTAVVSDTSSKEVSFMEYFLSFALIVMIIIAYIEK